MKEMHEHKFEIATGDDGTGGLIYSIISKGILNIEPSFNEELSQEKYHDGNGFGSTDVIGAQLVLTFSGHRDYEDEAQDFIFGKLLELGASRKTDFRWTEPDGGIFEGTATIANISGPSGASAAKGDISFEIHFNGKPTYTPAV